MKEHKFPLDSFIGGWYINTTVCDELLSYAKVHYYSSSHGVTGSVKKKDSKIKKSHDISNNIVDEPMASYREELSKVLEKYIERYDLNELYYFNIFERANIQYYKPTEGYYKFHMENNGAPNFNSLRVLVYMTYLNDVEDGGTIFKYQNIITPAKKGLTLLWPAYFTHVHKGQISQTSEKFIVTGWYSFRRTNENFTF